jgi:cytochrome c-type biogenesis protein CcmF
MANPLSVTEKFYNNISIPFGVMILGFIIAFILTIVKFEKRELAICIGTAVTAAVLSNVFFTFNTLAYIFSLISFFLVSLLLFHFYRSRKSWLLPAGLAHMGIAIFVIGVIISGIHSWTEQKKVSIGETVQAGPVSITLKGFTETDKSTVDAVIKKGMRTAEASMYYYIDSKTQSLYREPYIMSGLAGDIYITPQQYNFAAINYSTATLHEKEEKQVSGLTVKFNGFITNNMGAQGMVIRADILIDGMKYFPAVRFSNGETEQLNQTVQGSRTLKIEGIDATHKTVRIYLSPTPGAVIPPDFAVFDISMKRFIWIVWLGTILIASGFAVAMVRAFKKA